MTPQERSKRIEELNDELQELYRLNSIGYQERLEAFKHEVRELGYVEALKPRVTWQVVEFKLTVEPWVVDNPDIWANYNQGSLEKAADEALKTVGEWKEKLKAVLPEIRRLAEKHCIDFHMEDFEELR